MQVACIVCVLAPGVLLEAQSKAQATATPDPCRVEIGETYRIEASAEVSWKCRDAGCSSGGGRDSSASAPLHLLLSAERRRDLTIDARSGTLFTPPLSGILRPVTDGPSEFQESEIQKEAAGKCSKLEVRSVDVLTFECCNIADGDCSNDAN